MPCLWVGEIHQVVHLRGLHCVDVLGLKESGWVVVRDTKASWWMRLGYDRLCPPIVAPGADSGE